MSTIDTNTRNRTYSILASDLAVNGTTAVDSGLYVTVVANTAYRLECVLDTTGSADAILSRLVLGATPVQSGLFYELYDSGTAVYTAGSTAINTALGTGADFIRLSGIFVSNYTGILKVTVRETVDFGAASVIKAGSYLLVEPI